MDLVYDDAWVEAHRPPTPLPRRAGRPAAVALTPGAPRGAMTSTQTEPATPRRGPGRRRRALPQPPRRARRDGRLDPRATSRRCATALALHAEGETAQPLKPYLSWRENGHIADRIIAMPGYVGGEHADGGDQVDRLQARQPVRARHPARQRGDRAQRPRDALPGRDHGGRRDQRHAHRRRDRARGRVPRAAGLRDGRARSAAASSAACTRSGCWSAFPAIRAAAACTTTSPRRRSALAEEIEALGADGAASAETAEEAVAARELVVPCTVDRHARTSRSTG